MKKYTIPEWFLKLKKYNKYDLERAYYFCDRYSKNQLKKISKKEFCQIIKDCKKDKYPLSDSDLENMAFIDENIEDYTEELLELKISYLDKIYDNENTRQNIIDQKAQSNIGQTSLIIGIIGFLGAGGIFDLIKDIHIFFKIIFLIFYIALISVFCFSISYSVRALIPRLYTRPRQDLMKYGIKNDLKEQKLGYFISLYHSITWNQRTNTEKNDFMRKSQMLFALGLILLAIVIILLSIFLFFFSKTENSNIIFIFIKKLKDCFLGNGGVNI